MSTLSPKAGTRNFIGRLDLCIKRPSSISIIQAIAKVVQDLNAQLRKQLKVLASNCFEFDRGDEDYGPSMCHILRVLFHDTKNSHSLVGSLGLAANTFLSTTKSEITYSLEIEGKNVSNQFFLVKHRLAWEGFGMGYIPRLSPEATSREIPFTEWWSEEIVLKLGEIENSQNSEKQFTRKDIVVLFANKLGGSHVDIGLSQAQQDILHLTDDVIGWTWKNENGEKVPQNMSPFLNSARQIAHETFLSIERLASESNEVVNRYFSTISKYGEVGHNQNLWFTWYMKNSPLLQKLHDCFYITVNESNRAALVALRSDAQTDTNAPFAIELAHHLIIANQFGKLQLRESSQWVAAEFDYVKGDRIGFWITGDANNARIAYLLNDKVIYHAVHPSPIPLYAYFALQRWSSINSPTFQSGLTSLLCLKRGT